jgi:hypothetical protein
MAIPRLTVVAVLAGAALLGWAMGGVSSVGQRLQAASPQPRLERFVTDRHRDQGAATGGRDARGGGAGHGGCDRWAL